MFIIFYYYDFNKRERQKRKVGGEEVEVT